MSKTIQNVGEWFTEPFNMKMIIGVCYTTLFIILCQNLTHNQLMTSLTLIIITSIFINLLGIGKGFYLSFAMLSTKNKHKILNMMNNLEQLHNCEEDEDDDE